MRGILIRFTTLTAFTMVFRFSISVEAARTEAFLILALSNLIHIFECKSENKSIFKIPYANNQPLLISVFISAALAISSVFFHPLNLLLKTYPLTANQFLIVVACSVVVPLINAVVLKIKNQKRDSQFETVILTNS